MKTTHATPDDQPADTTIAGLRPRKRSTSWKLKRDLPGGGGQETCYLYDPTRHVQVAEFPRSVLEPSIEIIAQAWGSGTYQCQWLGADRKPLGAGPKFVIDDPARPPLPAKQHPTPKEAAPAPPPPEPPRPTAVAQIGELLATLAPGAQIPLAVLLPLGLELMRTWKREQAEEYELRYARIREEHDLALRREQERNKMMMDQQKMLFDAIAKANRDPVVDELRREVRELREERDSGPESPWAPIIEQVAPNIGPALNFLSQVAKASAPPVLGSTPPNGAK